MRDSTLVQPRDRRGRTARLLVLLLAAACRDDATAPESSGALVVAQSEVTVSAGIVASGDSVTLMLTVRDARGRVVDEGAHAVTFEATGGTSTGSIGTATYRGAGVFAASFTGVRAGTATTIGASIDGEPITRPLPTVRVRPGRFSPATSFTTVVPRTLTVGRQGTLTLRTRDAAGNALDAGGLQVAMRATGGSGEGSMGTVADNGDGTYSALFTATGVGTPLAIETLVDGVPIGMPAPTITVARGVSVDHSLVQVSSDTVMVDAGVTLTLEVRDSANVRRTSGGDTVQFIATSTASGTTETILDVTDHDDGSYSATYLATQARETMRIAAVLNGRVTRTATPTVEIMPVPLAAQHSTVSVSTSGLVAGTTATFRVVLRDLNGAPFTAGGHAVHFTIGTDGSSGGTIGAILDEGGGAYSASFLATRAGTPVTIGATIDDSTEIQMLDSLGVSQLPMLQVVPGAASTDSSLVSAFPTSISVGDTATLRLVARDAFGNLLGTGGQVVTFARAGGGSVSVGRIGPVNDDGHGTYTAPYVGESHGAPDFVRAAIDGHTLSMTTAITVIRACTPGLVSPDSSELVINELTAAPRPVKSLTLPSGVTTTLSLTVRDSRGCPVTVPHTVAFAVGGGTSTGALGDVVNQGDGTYTATLTGQIAGTTSEVAASIDGIPIISAAVTVTVVPGDVSPRTSLLTSSDSVVSTGGAVLVTLAGRDMAGNAVGRGGRQVTFMVREGGACGDIGATTDAGDGHYTATFTGRQGGATCTIVAFIEGTPVAATVGVRVASP